jgi:2-iminobutanoate/2-iminopropanoate deaminase
MPKPIALFLGILMLSTAVWVARGQKPSPPTAPPYSPARQAGPTLYVSGQIARTPDGKEVRDSVEAETRQVMENIGRLLKTNGYGFNDVVDATVYLADINDYAAMNKVYASYFTNGFPARACVGGASLVFGFKVEISAVAYKPGK